MNIKSSTCVFVVMAIMLLTVLTLTAGTKKTYKFSFYPNLIQGITLNKISFNLDKNGAHVTPGENGINDGFTGQYNEQDKRYEITFECESKKDRRLIIEFNTLCHDPEQKFLTTHSRCPYHIASQILNFYLKCTLEIKITSPFTSTPITYKCPIILANYSYEGKFGFKKDYWIVAPETKEVKNKTWGTRGLELQAKAEQENETLLLELEQRYTPDPTKLMWLSSPNSLWLTIAAD